MCIVTPLFVIGVASSSSRIVGKQVLVAAGLPAVALAIWSLSVPLNGWQEIAPIAANKGATAVAAAVAGALFGYFAEEIPGASQVRATWGYGHDQFRARHA
jgi:uncharacterized membrane protein YjfL (UPF0719 family)